MLKGSLGFLLLITSFFGLEILFCLIIFYDVNRLPNFHLSIDFCDPMLFYIITIFLGYAISL